MTWARIDDRLYDDPRFDAAGLEAMGLFLASLSYMGAYLTDGVIGEDRVRRFAGRRAPALTEKLVSAGWWERLEGGKLRLISWGNYLLSRDLVESERSRKSEAGRIGAERTNAKRLSSNSAGAAAGATGSSGASRARDPVPDPVPSRSNTKIPEGGNGGSVRFQASEPDPEQPSLPGIEAPAPKGAALEAAVFAEYLAARPTKGRAPVLDDKRRAYIRARLADGFTLEDLKAAARGIWRSDFHVQKGFTGFEYVVRDAKGVERFRDLDAQRQRDVERGLVPNPAARPPPISPRLQARLDAAEAAGIDPYEAKRRADAAIAKLTAAMTPRLYSETSADADR